MTSTARRVSARSSGIHGRGLFALADIAAGVRLMEYEGERIDWDEACQRYPGGHTFLFDLGDDTLIDGGSGGNSARWINHGCAPNCEAVDVEGRIYIDTLVPINTGDEILIDYALEVEDLDDAPLYACDCGAPQCRGTMLGTNGR